MPAEPPALALARLPAARRRVLEEIAADIVASGVQGRRTVAIDGMSGSGKTTFADHLAIALRARDVVTFRASLDDFLNPRAIRYRRGRHSAEGYYRDAYDLGTIRRVLLDPFRLGGSAGFVLAAFDQARDAPRTTEWTSAPVDAVLVVDGVLIQRPELRDAWDFVVWLDASEDVGLLRSGTRDGTDPDPASPYNRRYLGAQELYRAEVDPVAGADVVLDARDLDALRRI
ncbi:uridine kinase [Pseudolysinimonas sp.]|uniref:uridine kinase n=1 Tax=Pseudolysinimonas sp. TaxID=2680009 RepID=UPI003F7CE090